MYIIINPNNGAGMGSYIWQTLRGIRKFPNKKYYVVFSNCIYEDDKDTSVVSPFEYYFEQIHPKPTQKEIEFVIHNDENQETEYRDVFMHNPTDLHISQTRHIYNSIIESHLKLKPTVAEKIYNFYQDKLAGKNVLGIHLRGTDHPETKNFSLYLNYIAEISNNYDLIFLATDDQSNYNLLKNKFHSKLVTYESERSPDGKPIHWGRQVPGSMKKKIGEDVIIESYLLAKCNFLVLGTNSNVNYLARAINPTIEHILL